jgi:flagellar biosynthesis protein
VSERRTHGAPPAAKPFDIPRESAAGKASTPTPQPEAIALAYHEGDRAPRVVAKGRGLLAEEIIRRAREAGVFVHESRELVAVLTKLDLDSHIPPQLYLAIAEILAWVYRMEPSTASAIRPVPLPAPARPRTREPSASPKPRR